VENLRFTKDHLWVRVDGMHATIGISDHGQAALGAIQALELPDVGDAVERGESFVGVASRHTSSDLVSPVSGTVSAINVDLEDEPTLVNDDPHDGGWLVEIDLDDESELDELMDADEYDALVAEAD
jgi:glycine cleavage system H protein